MYVSHTPFNRSVNEIICHGIPDMRELCDGDICNGMLNSLIPHPLTPPIDI